jgi:predicted metal-binding protein
MMSGCIRRSVGWSAALHDAHIHLSIFSNASRSIRTVILFICGSCEQAVIKHDRASPAGDSWLGKISHHLR